MERSYLSVRWPSRAVLNELEKPLEERLQLAGEKVACLKDAIISEKLQTLFPERLTEEERIRSTVVLKDLEARHWIAFRDFWRLNTPNLGDRARSSQNAWAQFKSELETTLEEARAQARANLGQRRPRRERTDFGPRSVLNLKPRSFEGPKGEQVKLSRRERKELKRHPTFVPNRWEDLEVSFVTLNSRSESGFGGTRVRRSSASDR